MRFASKLPSLWALLTAVCHTARCGKPAAKHIYGTQRVSTMGSATQCGEDGLLVQCQSTVRIFRVAERWGGGRTGGRMGRISPARDSGMTAASATVS